MRARCSAVLVCSTLFLGLDRQLPAFHGVGFEWIVVPAVLAVLAAQAGRELLASTCKRLCYEQPALCALALADVAWTALSTAWSVDVRASSLEAARSLLTCCAVPVFVLQLRHERRAAILRGLDWATLALAVAALLGVLLAAANVSQVGAELGHRDAGSWPRATGFIGTPGYFGATMLVLAAIVAQGAHETRPNPRSRLLCGVALGACLASVSVASLACLVLCIDLAGRIYFVHLRATATALAAALALTMLYAHVHAVSLGPFQWARPDEPGYEPRGRLLHPLHSTRVGPAALTWHATGYAAIHAAHVQRLVQSPLGTGAGTFPTIPTGPILRSLGHWSDRAAPHSWLLARGSEGGLVGLSLAAGLLVVAVRRVIGAARAATDFEQRVALGAVCGILGLSVFYGDVVHQWLTAFLVALLARQPQRHALERLS